MPTADPAAQRALLDLAGVDRAAQAARHRRATLDELQVITAGTAQIDELSGRLVLAQSDVRDLDRAARKLDDEIESVRARAERDRQRLASPSVGAREVESLQSEVESLGRRQSTLEDDALESMEQRENAERTIAEIQAELTAVLSDVDAATAQRDQHYADIDVELADLAKRRAELATGVPGDVLTLYERIRSTGKVAAAALIGERCDACRMGLDRQFLDQIRVAPPDALHRCPECGAILLRG